MTAGTVHTTVDHAGAALWLPYPLAALLHTHTPRQPHTYLTYLAVAPHRQRNGVGGALLRHRHRICDTAGIASYLVATSPAAHNLYLRHDYRPTTRHPLALPDNGPPLWPMWRQPHPPSPPTDS